jgi:hypothetical protein
VQYTFFSAAHGTFSKNHHILGHKASLSKCRKIEIISCMLSDQNALKLELNNKKNSRKLLDNTLLHNQWVIEEIRLEIKRFLEANESEGTTYQNQWDTANAVLRGKFTAMNAYIKSTERSQINDLMLHLKLVGKQKQENPKTSRRKEIIKIRAEINQIETKNHMKKQQNKELVL